MAEWIDVNERVPDENIRVLVTGMSEYDNKIYTDIDTDRILNGKWVRWNELITHWQPLPEPPRTQKEEIMTDNEIIEALEHILSKAGHENHKCCIGCVNEKNCKTECGANIVECALDLINRQKAENKELIEDNADLNKTIINLLEQIKNIKSEARKEFAERFVNYLDIGHLRPIKRNGERK